MAPDNREDKRKNIELNLGQRREPDHKLWCRAAVNLYKAGIGGQESAARQALDDLRDS